MEHGMNCPHHADKDEACTCALTERTMHAAWRKRAEEAETRIAALESQVKALTEERYSLQFAVDFLNTMNDELGEWFTRITDDHGGWHEDLPTGEAHIEEIIGNLKKERDAQAEAVRVLGEAVYETAWQVTDEGCDVLHNVSPAVMTNTIARAAVEGGSK